MCRVLLYFCSKLYIIICVWVYVCVRRWFANLICLKVFLLVRHVFKSYFGGCLVTFCVISDNVWGLCGCTYGKVLLNCFVWLCLAVCSHGWSHEPDHPSLGGSFDHCHRLDDCLGEGYDHDVLCYLPTCSYTIRLSYTIVLSCAIMLSDAVMLSYHVARLWKSVLTMVSRRSQTHGGKCRACAERLLRQITLPEKRILYVHCLKMLSKSYACVLFMHCETIRHRYSWTAVGWCAISSKCHRMAFCQMRS